MLRAILVDDEPMSLDLLEIMLEEVGGFSIVGKYTDGLTALDELEESEPDIVFLDIEMPEMDGLSAAEFFLQRRVELEVVFTTAYQQYAIQAFEVHALDYLLKPVSKERLQKICTRLYRRTVIREDTSAVSSLRLQVMGGLELYDRHNQLVKWRTKKTKELFAYLNHHNGQPVYRNQILAELWPELSEERAQTLFHTTLYHLRHLLRSLGLEDAVGFTDKRYFLRTIALNSDWSRLTEMLKDESVSVKLLLELYSRDYLEIEGYLWARTEAERLKADYLQKLEEILPLCTGSELESVCRKLITLDPYVEKYYSYLLAHYGETRNEAALRQLYETLQERWKWELGISLSKETEKIYRAYTT